MPDGILSREDILSEAAGSEHVRTRFLDARELVCHIQQCLAKKLVGKQQRTIRRLSQKETERVVELVFSSFQDKEIGLKGLADIAKKELAILVIRKTTRKYSTTMMDGGIGPVEYFNLFYKENFRKFGVPANRISVVDSNLHTQLKKRHEFYKITEALKLNLAA